GASRAFRYEAGLRDEAQRDESTDAPVACGDRDSVSRRDRLRGEAFLVQRDQDAERVIVQEGPAISIVQQEVLRDEAGSRGRTTAILRSDEGHERPMRPRWHKSPRARLS